MLHLTALELATHHQRELREDAARARLAAAARRARSRQLRFEPVRRIGQAALGRRPVAVRRQTQRRVNRTCTCCVVGAVPAVRRRRRRDAERPLRPAMGVIMNEAVAQLDERYSDADAQPTPWAIAKGELEAAQLSWIATVRTDGRPHVTPHVAVWLDETLHFCKGPEEQRARSLASNPAVVATTGCNQWDHRLDVVVEGEAERVTYEATLERLAAARAATWDGRWKDGVTNEGFAHPDAGGRVLVFAVRATKILAFAKGAFSHTRYLPTTASRATPRNWADGPTRPQRRSSRSGFGPASEHHAAKWRTRTTSAPCLDGDHASHDAQRLFEQLEARRS